MSGLPADIPAQIARCLASGDRTVAKKLAGDLAAAIASGDAHGFGAELAALKGLAGTGAQDLGKLAKGAERPVLPPDLRARAASAVQAYERAADGIEKVQAERELRAVHDDMLARGALSKCLAEPKLMGALLQ